MSSTRVVITGYGVVSANAVGNTAFKHALYEGKSGIRHIERLEELGFACQVGGVCEGYEEPLAALVGEADLVAMSQGMKMGALAAFEAFQMAGLEAKPDDCDEVYTDTGAIIGTGIGGLDVFADTVYPAVEKGRVKRMGSSVVERIMCSGPSAKIGGLLGLGNQVTANSSACSTGTEAIIMGADRIRAGSAKRMVVGGVEAAHPHIWAGFDSMRVLCRKYNDTPEKASRPLSASAAGFIPSSGAGILVIEDLETAKARGATIYAEIIGSSINCGGMRKGGSMTAPSRDGVIRCIRAGMSQAGIQAEDLDYINGHLTATMADPMEIQNWHLALECSPEELPLINSTKSMLGHSLGATGAIESVATLIQMNHGFIHGSLNCEDLHEGVAPFSASIIQKTVERPIHIAAKASFGFGDVNSCLIFKNRKD